MIILRQKEFKRGDADRLDLNLIGNYRYKKGLSTIKKDISGSIKDMKKIKPSSTVSSDKHSIFNSHKLNTLLIKLKTGRENLEQKITDNPWNKKGAIPRYIKQLVLNN